jgi:hypothetical protein
MASFRHNLWQRHVGNFHFALCTACKYNRIEEDNFFFGYMISKKNGGQSTIDNMRPICKECSEDIGNMNLLEYRNLLRYEAVTRNIINIRKNIYETLGLDKGKMEDKGPISILHEIYDNVEKLLTTNTKLSKEIALRQKEEIANSCECAICLENINKRIVLVPCGHSKLCENCILKTEESSERGDRKCPLCRKEYSQYIYLF